MIRYISVFALQLDKSMNIVDLEGYFDRVGHRDRAA